MNLTPIQEQTLRAVAALGRAGGVPHGDHGRISPLGQLAVAGLIEALPVIDESHRAYVRVTIDGTAELERCSNSIRVAEVLAERCHDMGGSGKAVSPENVACIVHLIAGDSDAADLFSLYVARCKAQRSGS